MRIKQHPILGNLQDAFSVTIYVDGQTIAARESEPIAAALVAAGIKEFRTTAKRREPRGIFCAIGQCTDCMMTVDGIPNVRTCVTPVRNGMNIETQKGLGRWEGK